MATVYVCFNSCFSMHSVIYYLLTNTNTTMFYGNFDIISLPDLDIGIPVSEDGLRMNEEYTGARWWKNICSI